MQILGFISDDGNIGRQPTYLKKKTWKEIDCLGIDSLYIEYFDAVFQRNFGNN
jgi:hypothetical protein